MTANRVLKAQLNAQLAKARQRWDSLEYRWQRAKYTSSGGSDTPEDIDVELAEVNAQILELEEQLAQADATPAAVERSAVDLASPPANDAPAPAVDVPEYLSTKQAAALLGVSVKHLETLRVRGEGPPHVRLGRAIRYPRATLTVR